jgi:hypothetical protein
VNLPTAPDGWPIGSYDTYQEARRAVGHLATSGFPIENITIVGVEPMLVERVTARITWRRVLATGAVLGAFLGLFAGLLLNLFTSRAGAPSILIGLVSGVGFGMCLAAFRYVSANGPRDFVSHSQLVAHRYDVLCQPRTAESGRQLLAAFALKGSPSSAS